MSINNALIIEKSKIFTLLVDPQHQGLTWLKNQYDGGGTLVLIQQEDPQFKKLVEMAVENGRTVIVDQVGDKIGINLHSLMKREINKYGSNRMISFCRKQYKFDKNFRLFVISSNDVPLFDVNITNHISLINFGVNLESL